MRYKSYNPRNPCCNKRDLFPFYSAGVTGSKSYLKSRSDPKGSVPNTRGTICQIHFPQSDRVYYPGEQPSSAEVSFLVRVSVCVCVCMLEAIEGYT